LHILQVWNTCGYYETDLTLMLDPQNQSLDILFCQLSVLLAVASLGFSCTYNDGLIDCVKHIIVSTNYKDTFTVHANKI